MLDRLQPTALLKRVNHHIGQRLRGVERERLSQLNRHRIASFGPFALTLRRLATSMPI
jgi:hypothetical protein